MILKKLAASSLILSFLGLPALAAPATASYTCDNGSYTFTVTIPTKKRLTLVDGAGNKATMKRQVSGSGLFYTGRDKEGAFYEFSAKGKSALLIIDKKYRHENCTIVGSSK